MFLLHYEKLCVNIFTYNYKDKEKGVIMIEASIKNQIIKLWTMSDVFSPKAVDKGTLAMLRQVEFSLDDKVLDLGCGCGVVGITAAKIIGGEKVFCCDVSENSVELTRKNAGINGVPDITVILSDGFRQMSEKDFTIILSNPPYHTDFSVAKHFIEKGFNRLALGGRMLMVTKRRDWYKNKLIAIFGGVKIVESDGYFVFIAEKRSLNYSKSKK